MGLCLQEFDQMVGLEGSEMVVELVEEVFVLCWHLWVVLHALVALVMVVSQACEVYNVVISCVSRGNWAVLFCVQIIVIRPFRAVMFTGVR